MFLVFDWWLDVIWLKSHRNATNCIDFNIVIRILNTPVSAKMAQGQRKWHVVNGILTPSRYFNPPNITSNGIVCYVQLLNVVYCCKYIIFMKVWVVQNESIIDTKEIIYMILILSYIFPSKYERQTKLCRRLFQGVKYLGRWGGVQNTIFWPSGRVGIYFGSINKSIITIQDIIDLISI